MIGHGTGAGEEEKQEEEEEGGQEMPPEEMAIAASAEIHDTPVIMDGAQSKLQEEDVRVKSMASLGGGDSRLSQTKKADELVIVAKDGQPIAVE